MDGVYLYTRTCPDVVPFPSFSDAPITTTVPSDERSIEPPE